MKTTHISIIASFFLTLVAFICLPSAVRAAGVASPDGTDATKFTLVIDAGHGGHDSGAVGSVAKEKTINLNVALALGKLIEQNCPDVKVIYTRKTDVFVALQERANIANRNKADLFISIHTNAVASNKGSVYGAETYTLGMHRASENLEVAKRENSVITMETDYKTKYQGFDPNKAESYIIFELMQDKYMAQSVKLAKAIQQQYTSAGRKNKGVHQAGFLVLRQTSMPSVLTELGFISNPTEEAFLNSTDGVNKLARSIYDGFRNYRKQLAATTDSEPAPESIAPATTAEAPLLASAEATKAPATTEAPATTAPVEQIQTQVAAVEQVLAATTPVVHEGATPSPTRPIDDDVVPSIRPVTTTPYPISTSTPKENATPNSNAKAKAEAPKPAETKKPAEQKTETPKPAEAKKPAEQKAEAPKPAEVKKATVPEASAEGTTAHKTEGATAPKTEAAPAKPVFRIQLLTCSSPLKDGDARLKGLPAEYYMDGATYKYTYGNSTDYNEIVNLKKTIADKFPGVFIIALLDGKRIDLQEGIKLSK